MKGDKRRAWADGSADPIKDLKEMIEYARQHSRRSLICTYADICLVAKIHNVSKREAFELIPDNYIAELSIWQYNDIMAEPLPKPITVNDVLKQIKTKPTYMTKCQERLPKCQTHKPKYKYHK